MDGFLSTHKAPNPERVPASPRADREVKFVGPGLAAGALLQGFSQETIPGDDSSVCVCDGR